MDQTLVRAAELLPTGGTLTRHQWGRRHAVLTAVLAAHVPVLLVLGAVASVPARHLLVELLLPAAGVAAARCTRLSDRVRSHATALGLVLCSALLVHLTGGSIEAHFHFFLVVSAVACYQQWSVLGATVVFTVVHHVGLSALDPGLVFAHAGDGRSWLLWSLLHGLAIAGQCAVALTHWRIHEQALAAERRLAGQLLQREAVLQQALRRAEVDALAAGVAHDLNTPLQYATDNARYLGDALLDLVDVTSRTSDALTAQPAEQCPECWSGLEPVVELLRRHELDWDSADLRRAVTDCLLGLDELARVAVQLQDAGAAARVPRARAEGAPVR